MTLTALAAALKDAAPFFAVGVVGMGVGAGLVLWVGC